LTFFATFVHLKYNYKWQICKAEERVSFFRETSKLTITYAISFFLIALCSYINKEAKMESYVERGDKWLEIAQKTYKAKEKREYYTKLEKELQKELKSLSGNKSSEAGGYKFSCVKRKGSVDYAVIPELTNIDLEPYRKPQTESWILSFNKANKLLRSRLGR
jgi:hypothetical protein